MVAEYVTMSPDSKSKIIALCFYAQSPLIEYLKPEYFGTSSESRLVTFLLKYRADYKAAPTWSEVCEHFGGDSVVIQLLDQIKPLCTDFDQSLLEHHAAEFIKYQVSAIYRDAISACVDVLGGAEADGYLWNFNFRKRIIALAFAKDWLG